MKMEAAANVWGWFMQQLSLFSEKSHSKKHCKHFEDKDIIENLLIERSEPSHSFCLIEFRGHPKTTMTRFWPILITSG